MRRAVIVDSVRTGITAGLQGELRWLRPDDMAARCVDALMHRNPEVAPHDVDDCVIGCAFPEGPQGMNLGRNVATLSVLGPAVAGLTVSRYCASGLDAVATAASRIISGMCEVVVAGGVESVSMTMRNVNTFGLFNPEIQRRSPGTYLEMNIDDPRVPFWKRAFRSMGATAELVAERYQISREAQDAFACRSQQRTAAAQAAGRFDDELIDIATEVRSELDQSELDQSELDQDGEPPPPVERLANDRCGRPETTPAGLAALEPAFRPGGTVTAGNSSPIADGAASCLLVSERYARDHQLEPLGYFRSHAMVGCEPELMARGPVLAIPKLLRQLGYALRDIDLLEINEAFASQMVYALRALDLDEERVNVDGGAISLGHPFGMTGVRLVGHLLRELRRRQASRGIVAICIGGGMGSAALLET